MTSIKIQNQSRFNLQIMNIIRDKINPTILESINKGHDVALKNTPVVTGVLKSKIQTTNNKRVIKGKVSNKLYIKNPQQYEDVLSKMQFGFQDTVVIKEQEGLWQWVIDRGLTNKFRIDGMMNIGQFPTSPFNGGGKNPILLGKTKIMLEIERKLNTTFN